MRDWIHTVMDSPDDCVVIDENFTSEDITYWSVPKSTGYFDTVNYDVDSVVLVGDADLSWLSPPFDFECRLDIQHAVLLDDKKV